MSIIESLPDYPLSKNEIERLEAHDRVHGVAPIGLKDLMTDQTAIAELVVVTDDVVVGLAFVDNDWEMVYRGRKGEDGEQSELFDEAWTAVEENPGAPDDRYRGPLDG